MLRRLRLGTLRLHILAWLCAATLAPAAPSWGCDEPLDDETLGNLLLFTPRPSVRPGDSLQYTLGYWECCVFMHRVPACTEWAVDPPNAATLEILPEDAEPYAASVKLTVKPGVVHGTVVTLRADVESGRRVLETKAYVYDPEMNPLVGTWREEYQLNCPRFVRGDVDQGGSLEITDAIRIFGYLFLGDNGPACLDSADSNRDGIVDISDGVFLLNFLFSGSAEPPVPFPACDTALITYLDCESFPSCGSGEPTVVPERPIEELIFEADGSFRVTWTPFEIYVDYWGRYTFDPGTGAMVIEAVGGNYVPPDVRSLEASRFAVREGKLYLHNLWLGSPSGSDPVFRCGHVFE